MLHSIMVIGDGHTTEHMSHVGAVKEALHGMACCLARHELIAMQRLQPTTVATVPLQHQVYSLGVVLPQEVLTGVLLILR